MKWNVGVVLLVVGLLGGGLLGFYYGSQGSNSAQSNVSSTTSVKAVLVYVQYQGTNYLVINATAAGTLNCDFMGVCVSDLNNPDQITFTLRPSDNAIGPGNTPTSYNIHQVNQITVQGLILSSINPPLPIAFRGNLDAIVFQLWVRPPVTSGQVSIYVSAT